MAEDLKTIQTVDLSPFKCMVMTIGELPSSFVESMTYYEALAWLDNYLEKTLIPAVNNNAEAVQELQDLYIVLHDYVENYFDNLDVQEEINNKLDEMAEDGQLTQLIAQFLSLNAVMSFPSVAAMKLAENLVNGSTCETYGFYNVNDGGGAKYLVRTITNDDTIDEKTIIELYDDYLIAELIKEDTMNVKQFGAKGDGTTDDTLSIQTAVDNCLNVHVPNGTYMVDAETHINLRTGSKFTLNNDATIKAITNDLTTYTILLVEDCTDVEISGGTIEGDRDTHTGATGEWGHCIRLWGSSNRIYIHDINLINAWGDGLDCDITGSAVTARVHVNNARRNGYSITKADSFISNDDIIENTHGTSPQCGVDIEPNASTDILKNIIFNGLRTKNNGAYGINFALIGGNGSDNLTSIEVNNMRSDGDHRGIGGTIRYGRIGNIDIKNPVILNSRNNAILLTQQSLMPICIDHPIIRYYGASSSSSVAIDINGSIPEGATAVGNINIINPIVTDPVLPSGSSITLTWAIYAHAPLTNVHIVDPIDLDGRLVRLGMASGNLITDKFKLFKRDINANYTISSDNMYLLTTSSSYTANHFVNIRGDQAYPIGTVFNFINTGNYRMEVQFPDNYVYPISSTTGSSVYLNDKGASMTIQRISNDAWAIVNQNGNITTS